MHCLPCWGSPYSWRGSNRHLDTLTFTTHSSPCKFNRAHEVSDGGIFTGTVVGCRREGDRTRKEAVLGAKVASLASHIPTFCALESSAFTMSHLVHAPLSLLPSGGVTK